MKHTPYLIQRGKFQDRDWKKGIDTIINFEYMGSAEFEFGALGDSLSEIRNNIDSYIYSHHEIKDTNGLFVTVFSHIDDVGEVYKVIDDLWDGKLRLKEHSNIKSLLKPKGDFVRTNLWWDIDNHYMFFESNVIFQNKFKELIKKQN